LLRYTPADDVLTMERVRALDMGHGPGVDEGIRNLLAAGSKREAQKLASALVLTGQGLFDLVTNCGTIGYTHDEGHRRDTPEDRALTSEERVGLLYSKGTPDPKTLRKIRDGYREQRHLSWHTLTSNADAARWHCFFYETRDVHGEPLSGRPQSEKIGPHVHYASSLFHLVPCAEFVTWMKPGARAPHGIHLRFRTSFTEADLQGAEELFGDVGDDAPGDGGP
jgi:hypothetical protein